MSTLRVLTATMYVVVHRAAVKASPDKASHWTALGSAISVLAETATQHENAAKCFKKALKLDPDATEAKSGLKVAQKAWKRKQAGDVGDEEEADDDEEEADDDETFITSYRGANKVYKYRGESMGKQQDYRAAIVDLMPDIMCKDEAETAQSERDMSKRYKVALCHAATVLNSWCYRCMKMMNKAEAKYTKMGGKQPGAPPKKGGGGGGGGGDDYREKVVALTPKSCHKELRSASSEGQLSKR